MKPQWREAVIIILFLSLPILVFYSNSKAPRDHNTFDRIVLTITAPVQVLFDMVFESISDAMDHYVFLMDTAQENKALEKKIASLQLEMQQLKDKNLELMRLKELENINRSPGFTYLSARVISISPTPLRQAIRIDLGSADGIFVGAGVITASGIVGRVAAVNYHSALVILLIDANSTLDVLIERSRTRGILRGLGKKNEFEANVQYILRTDDVSLGDTVISSGHDGIFPRGLRVGSIIELKKKHYGLYQQVLVQTSADFSHLEEVLVVIPEQKLPEISMDGNSLSVKKVLKAAGFQGNVP